MKSSFESSSIIGKAKTAPSKSEIEIPVRYQLISKKLAKRNVTTPAINPQIRRKTPILGENLPLK
jgi:hypothetical protein